jgi:hypothetical protein
LDQEVKNMPHQISKSRALTENPPKELRSLVDLVMMVALIPVFLYRARFRFRTQVFSLKAQRRSADSNQSGRIDNAHVHLYFPPHAVPQDFERRFRHFLGRRILFKPAFNRSKRADTRQRRAG